MDYGFWDLPYFVSASAGDINCLWSLYRSTRCLQPGDVGVIWWVCLDCLLFRI